MSNSKRTFPFQPKTQGTPPSKKGKLQLAKNIFKNEVANDSEISNSKNNSTNKQNETVNVSSTSKKNHVPLAEKMRPNELIDYVGQSHLIGPNTLLYDLLKNGTIPSMILWGPPGCGKTSLVNIIMKESKGLSNRPVKFIKLSATTASINDVRKAVTEAENQSKQGGLTVVFMDEIHRFNKLQQDIFLPHVEAGTFILIGATTENPSSSLNSALLSRCRVFILKKLQKNEVIAILTKAIISMDGKILQNEEVEESNCNIKFFIDKEIIDWLADVCDGDARIALGALEIAVKSELIKTNINEKPIKLLLNDIKSSLQQTQTLTDKKSDNINHMYSAMHFSIVGDDENSALYWLVRIMETGEDPVFIAKRLIRIASENISLDDTDALSTAVHTMQACQMIGMPECDVILTQCVTHLARTEKSKEVLNAFKKSLNIVENHKGPQPKVPLFIKDTSAQGKLKFSLGRNLKNLVRQENQNKSYLPEGLENVNFFDDQDG